MLNIAILGEIGSGNLGDDFCYMLLHKAIMDECQRRRLLVTIQPLTPGRFQMLDNHHFHLVVLGGGTLMDTCKGPYMERIEKRMNNGHAFSVLGSGINDPSLFPQSSEGRELLPRLKEYAKVYIERTEADPICLAGSVPGLGARSNKIGINIGYTAKSRIDMDQVFGYLKNVYSVARSKDLEVVFLSAWHADDGLVKALQYGCYPSTFEYIDGTERSMKILSGLRNVFATRVHLGALAAMCGALPIQMHIANKATEVITGIHGNCLVPDMLEAPPVEADLSLVGAPRPEEAAAVLREGIAKTIGLIL